MKKYGLSAIGNQLKTQTYPLWILIGTVFFPLLLFAQSPAPYGALPSERQLKWHETEFYGLVHFTPTTFENKEWGYGDASPSIFNFKKFHAKQLAKTAKAAGMKALIFVAKHHDGFALWPTTTSSYNIAYSPYKKGKGDLVKELSDAARKQGLKFGVYCSPWDRHDPDYGSPRYLETYRKQLEELYTHYGPLFMSWHDGANGGSGFYGGARETRSIDNTRYYDWENTWKITRQLQAEAAIFSDVGPDVRWVGNEEGHAADTSWATFTPRPPKGLHVAVPGQSNYTESPGGTRQGDFWMPAECDVPLRKGWFYHPGEKPKTAQELFDLYLKSVGHGAALDLGLAPTTEGRLHAEDVRELRQLGKTLRRVFRKNLAQKAEIKASNTRTGDFSATYLTANQPGKYWATEDNERESTLFISFSRPTSFDLIKLEEYIPLGQRVAHFQIEIQEKGEWITIAKGASIGAKRLIKLPRLTNTERVRITLRAPVSLTLQSIGLYRS